MSAAHIVQIKEDIKPHLAELENLRVQCYDKYLTRKKIARTYGWPAFVVAACVEWFVVTETAVLSIMALIALWAWVWCAELPYKKRYKHLVIPAIVNSFKGQFEFHPVGFKNGSFAVNQQDIDAYNRSHESGKYKLWTSIKNNKTVQKLASDFHIVPSFSSCLIEDSFRGRIGDDIFIEFCEMKLERGSGKDRKTVFGGVTVVLTMPFEFMAHTVIGKDGGKLGNFLIDRFAKLETVHLEDVEFEKRYQVLSSDQQAARYIVTPAFMERLMDFSVLLGSIGFKGKLAERLNSKQVVGPRVECEFKGNRALFMAPMSADLFECSGLEKSVYELSDVEFLYHEISTIVGIAEQLKLDYLAARKKAVKNISLA